MDDVENFGDHGESFDEIEDDLRDPGAMNSIPPENSSTTTEHGRHEKEEKTSWFKTNRVFLMVGVITALIGLVVISTQLGFYREIKGLTVKLTDTVSVPIWILFPFAVEGLSWTFGAMATQLARLDKPGSGARLRWMWLFAGIAAFVNVYHNVKNLNDPLTGFVAGGLSLAGPFLWHSYTGLTSAMASDKTTAQVKLAVKTRILHPWLSLRADRIQTLIQVDRTTAWRYALAYGVTKVREKVSQTTIAELDNLAVPVAVEVTRRPARRVISQPRTKAEARPKQLENPATGPDTSPSRTAPPEQPGDATIIDIRDRPEAARKVITAYHEMKEKGLPISMRKVDAYAGVKSSNKVLPGYIAELKAKEAEAAREAAESVPDDSTEDDPLRTAEE